MSRLAPGMSVPTVPRRAAPARCGARLPRRRPDDRRMSPHSTGAVHAAMLAEPGPGKAGRVLLPPITSGSPRRLLRFTPAAAASAPLPTISAWITIPPRRRGHLDDQHRRRRMGVLVVLDRAALNGYVPLGLRVVVSRHRVLYPSVEPGTEHLPQAARDEVHAGAVALPSGLMARRDQPDAVEGVGGTECTTHQRSSARPCRNSHKG